MTPEQYQQLKAAFLDAVDLPSEEQSRHVEKACAMDPVIRERAMALLHAHGRAGSFLESVIFALGNDPSGADGEPDAAELESPDLSIEIGRRIAGRYEIRREIGRGGFGIVYEAFDTSALKRTVAVKIMRPTPVGSPTPVGRAAADRQRFLDEARLAGGLSHDNIATVYDVGEDSGMAYMTQEFVKGRDLKALLKERGPLRAGQAVSIALQVCGALSYAHSRGVTHRDIKPSNIIVDDADRVKITDFGLAQPVAPEGRGGSKDRIGTPGYMAPEQLRGGKSDGRVDVFAIGSVLFEMLTGRGAFEGETLIDVIANTMGLDPVLPDRVRAEMPRGLDAVVARALEKDPERRYPSVAALADDMRKRDGGDALRSFSGIAGFGPVSTPKAGRSFSFRFWVVAALIAAAAVGLGLWLGRPEPGGRDRVDAPLIPLYLDVLPQSIVARDALGTACWSHVFEKRLDLFSYQKFPDEYYRFFDFDRDGLQGMFFAARYEADGVIRNDDLLLFDHDGSLLWQVPVGKPVRVAGADYSGNFHVRFARLLGTKPEDFHILVLANHVERSPQLVRLFDLSGKVVREYLHNGWFKSLLLWDADGDGAKEIMCGGVSDRFASPVVVILRPESFGGESPLEASEPGAPGSAPAAGGKAGSSMYYIRFPNVDFPVPASFRSMARGLHFDGNRLRIDVGDDDENVVFYYLTPGVPKVEGELKPIMRHAYEESRKKDPSLRLADERLAAYLDDVRFWDGRGWVKTPTRVEGR